MAIDTLVLGIGNVLWADEGFGVRAVAALNEGWSFPESVTLMDGGTLGLYLLPYVQEARRILVFDAIDYGLAPGTLQVVRDGDIPAYLGVGIVQYCALKNIDSKEPTPIVGCLASSCCCCLGAAWVRQAFRRKAGMDEDYWTDCAASNAC